MKDNQKSEDYQKNNLKAIINFSEWLYNRDGSLSFFDFEDREVFLKFLNTKMKDVDIDPEGRWITTWNDYLDRIKVFYRWLYNYQMIDEKNRLAPEDWTTPDFIKIKHRKSQRISPYSANEIWELDEILTIVKYEPHPRNKAAIMLLWDLDARNKEITHIEIRNIRLKEQYAEGEIPKGKTGSGPILLTASFPYVRDWLNLHPLKDYPKAKLICHTSNGKPVSPSHLWTIMNTLRKRIQTLINEGNIEDEREREHLKRLLREKKWNPYCFRHSAITHDSDYLPGYALNKKVRWSMTSKQPARYIKNRMGNTLKNTILQHNGIEADQTRPRPTTRICPKCSTVNALENDYCSKKECGYPLTVKAYEITKEKEMAGRIESLEKKIQENDSTMRQFQEFLISHPEILRLIHETKKKEKSQPMSSPTG
jgi:integrase